MLGLMRKLYTNNPVLWSALLSGMLALYLLPLMGHLNTDGIFYLRVAQQFLDQPSLMSVSTDPLYGWSFFSIFIAFTKRLTGLSLLVSAQLICVFFQIMIAVGYVLILKTLGGSKRVQWIGLVCILALPHLNDYRAYVVRDFGYWAGYLFALLALLKFMRKPSWLLALLWGGASLGAALFRVEGVLFLFIMPIFFCFNGNYSWRKRLLGLLQLYSLLLGLLVIVLGFVFTSLKVDLSIFSRLDEFNIFFTHGLSLAKQHYVSTLTQMQAVQSNILAARALPKVMVFGLSIYLVYKIFSVTDFVFTTLICYGLVFNRPNFNRSDWLVLIPYMIINLLIAMVFVILFFFLSGRYIMALSLTLLVILPFTLDDIFTRIENSAVFAKKWRWLKPGFVILVIIFLADAIISTGPSKHYLKQSGYWLAHNTPKNSVLYTNSEHILFYARGAIPQWSEWLISDEKHPEVQLKNADYLVLRVSHKRGIPDSFSTQLQGNEPIKVFNNNHDDQVLIYKVN